MPSVSLTVNGRLRKVDAPPEESLLSVLRNRLDLTGSKYGCGEGQCGACMVLLDGEAVTSCRTTLAEVAGKKVVTIEGLALKDKLHPMQTAFLEHEAFQCGYCTSGMIMASIALLKTNPNPSPDDVANGLVRNVCRCGTYPRILAAVQAASKKGPVA
jgi:aerobic-type carbon monoxide dehydrogenase small subunit (CoxS/CutS family)